MSDKPTSPYAGLDKFLLQSTRDARETDQPSAVPRADSARARDEQPASTPLPAGPAGPARAPGKAGPETRKHGNTQTRLHVAAALPGPRARPKQANIERPDGPELLKYSVYFTQADLDELEDLKIALRRKNGLACTKYNIVRQALLDLLDDYKAQGDDSRLVRRLRNGTTY